MSLPPKWRMIYTTYSGVRYGEILDAHDRVFNFSLLGPNNLTFRQELVNPLTEEILTNREGLILVYRDRKLAMTAEIGSVQVSGDDNDHQYTVTATETMWTRLAKRLLGKSAAGLKGPTSPTDQGQWMMYTNLASLNGINATGLGPGTVDRSGDISGGVWRYKSFMELLTELSATTAGYDFYQRPRDPSAAAGLTGVIEIKPVIGDVRPNIVFQYGSGISNARSYEWITDTTQIINRAVALPPDFPDSPGLKVAETADAASIILRGMREEVIPTDLSSLYLRQAMAGLHVKLRKTPKETFVIQPQSSSGTASVPEFIEDYNVGDIVRGHVQDQSLLMLDAMVRVYGVTASVSDEGQETIDLTLINDGATGTG